ncbi:putative membrane protein [Microbacterium murale]|uniref:Membrane protein n=2 Tax=Microbacterium murale TaxID=1081040 RepID=A0ABU0PCC7_9MICO|nr:putative membrane protein [Microbacterium murale]
MMMAKADRSALDAPLGRGSTRQRPTSRDRFGRFTEWVARAMGTPAFLLILTLFCVAWIVWNTLLPEQLRFDDAALGFTALTLMLSLQASYAAPLILLAQNRQDDRDRVQIEQDRQRAERNLADTEYLAREIVALRMALEERNNQAVTRDVLRQELKSMLADLDDERDDDATDPRTGPATTRPNSPRT